MKKSISKVLTLMLSFAMVFTSIGWIGASEVNAESSTIRIKVVDQNDNVVNNVYLSVKPYTDDAYFEASPTDTDGVYDYCIEEDSLDVFDPDEEYELPLLVSDASSETVEYIATDPEVKVTVKNGLFLKVGNDPYDGTTTITLKVKKESTDTLPAVEDFNNVDKDVWDQYGINYTDIDLTKDFIVDVRHTDSSVSSGAPFVDFAKDPHFVNSNEQCADVTGGVVAAGSAQAAKLDELYTKAGDKRLVIICYGGMTMAKRAMQHFNAKGDVALGPKGKVTYLIGGSNAVLSGDYKYNLGIGNADIDLSKDVILDVRGADDFNSGHLVGAIGVDLMNNTAADKSAELDSALASVPEGGKLVVVCYQGRGLANKAIEYFMKNASKDDLKKVSYIIGGATKSENYGIFTGEEKARTMEVNIDMTKYPKGEVVRTWIPVPQSDEYQTVSKEEFWANKAKVAEFKTFKSGEFTNKLLYVEWGADAEPADRTACLKYDAKRKLVSNNGIIVATDDTEFPVEVLEYISETSKYVQIDGIVEEKANEITADKETTYDKARAIYEWCINNLERIDNNETLECKEGSPEPKHTFKVVGCGYGDTKTILSDLDTYGRAGGHCTDINSVFVALCRASGIPAREMFGIRMSDDATGGQHCWAEFYQPGSGWVLADPGDVCKFGVKDNKSNVNMTLAQLEEARKSEKTAKYTKELWGGVDNNRVVLSRGRDVNLVPAQTGDAYNTFGYPCGEHNGQRIECTDAKNFVYTIASKPYGSAITPAPAAPAPAPAAPAVTDGQTATVGGNTYKVTSASAKTAAFTKAKKSKKSATVPATVTVNGVKLNVTSIAPKAFKGTKVKTLTVKSKKLTKKSVKGSLKGSKVKTVKVKVGKKKENKKYVKKYKKIFTKKNCGKKVKVK